MRSDISKVKLSFSDITAGKVFYQSETGYKFSTDSIELFNYIKKYKSQKFIELGCGDGIISVLYALEYPDSQVYSLDINLCFIENLKLTIANNHIKNITVIHEDLIFYSIYSKQKYDIVIINPPYYKCCEGKLNENINALIAKHQILCDENDFLTAARRLTDNAGKFVFIYPAYKINSWLLGKIRIIGFYKINIVDSKKNNRFKIIELC